MPALSEIVSITISVDTLSIALASFGIPLIPSCSATWAERFRVYQDLPSIATDFPTTSPEYRAGNAIFGQSPHPDSLIIGRMVGKPTQAYQINVSSVAVGSNYAINVSGQGVTDTQASYIALADLTGTFLPRVSNILTLAAHGMTTGDGPYRVSNSGGALPTGLAVDTNYWIIANTAGTFSFASSKANAIALTPVALSGDGSGVQTLRRAQNDVICAQLVQDLAAVVGANYTATQVTGAGETDYITVTGTAPGNWFSLEVTNPALLKNQQTHVEPSPTVATDLAAIQVENDDWYGIVSMFNSDAYIKAFAAWTSAQTKIYIADLCASDTVQLAVGGGGTADDLKNLAYSRTAVMYHPSPKYCAGAAWFGATFPIDPGSDNWMYQTLQGVPVVPLTSTQRLNLRNKFANSYYAYAGEPCTFDGTTCDGDFIDVTRGIDWLEDDMQKAVFAMLKKQRTKKMPYTTQGIALVAAEVRGSLKRAVAAGVINDDFVIIVPAIADVPALQKAKRRLPGVKWSATLQGAVNKVDIEGVVNA